MDKEALAEFLEKLVEDVRNDSIKVESINMSQESKALNLNGVVLEYMLTGRKIITIDYSERSYKYE